MVFSIRGMGWINSFLWPKSISTIVELCCQEPSFAGNDSKNVVQGCCTWYLELSSYFIISPLFHVGFAEEALPAGWTFKENHLHRLSAGDSAGFHVDHPIPKDDFGLIKLAIIDLVTLVTMLLPSIIRGSCKIVPSSNDWPNKNSRRYMMEIFG